MFHALGSASFRSLLLLRLCLLPHFPWEKLRPERTNVVGKKLGPWGLVPLQVDKSPTSHRAVCCVSSKGTPTGWGLILDCKESTEGGITSLSLQDSRHIQKTPFPTCSCHRQRTRVQKRQAKLETRVSATFQRSRGMWVRREEVRDVWGQLGKMLEGPENGVRRPWAGQEKQGTESG